LKLKLHTAEAGEDLGKARRRSRLKLRLRAAEAGGIWEAAATVLG